MMVSQFLRELQWEQCWFCMETVLFPSNIQPVGGWGGLGGDLLSLHSEYSYTLKEINPGETHFMLWNDNDIFLVFQARCPYLKFNIHKLAYWFLKNFGCAAACIWLYLETCPEMKKHRTLQTRETSLWDTGLLLQTIIINSISAEALVCLIKKSNWKLRGM